MTTVTATPRTRFVTSADGTAIAYDVAGTGPAVVVVEGALCQRTMGTARAVAPLLSEHYAVVAYDRRGRHSFHASRAPKVATGVGEPATSPQGQDRRDQPRQPRLAPTSPR